MLTRFTITASLLFLLTILTMMPAAAQEQPTATPISVNLSNVVPPTDAPVAGPSPTRTPTETGGILLEAREFANVRNRPSTDGTQLGVIRSGEQYRATGRYFGWYQLQFPSSPTGFAWVFGELVTLTESADLLPEINVDATPTVNPAVFNATNTQQALALTPGGLLTATAQVGVAGNNPAGGNAGAAGAQTPQFLPTFTYPPNIAPIQPSIAVVLSTPTPEAEGLAQIVTVETADVPPIAPVLLLGGLGLLGLAISSIRRS